VLSVPKRTPRILLNTDEYPECVEITPRVFGPVTTSYIHGLSYRQAFSIAVTYLTTDAHDWFIANQTSATAAGHPMTSLVALTEDLSKRFSPLNKVKLARDKLSRWRQLKDVPSYNTDFVKIILYVPHIGLANESIVTHAVLNRTYGPNCAPPITHRSKPSCEMRNELNLPKPIQPQSTKSWPVSARTSCHGAQRHNRRSETHPGRTQKVYERRSLPALSGIGTHGTRVPKNLKAELVRPPKTSRLVPAIGPSPPDTVPTSHLLNTSLLQEDSSTPILAKSFSTTVQKSIISLTVSPNSYKSR
jgi:hypothetical protein